MVTTTTDAEVNESSATPLEQAAKANLRTSILLLIKEVIFAAIEDARIERGHLRVLVAIGKFLSNVTGKAWPARASIAAMTGMSEATVAVRVSELKRWGFLFAGRETVPEANNRRLTVYTYGNIDHATIERQIDNVLLGDGGPNLTAGSNLSDATLLSAVNYSLPPAVKITARSKETLQPAVSSNSKRNNTQIAGGDADPTPAPRKREAKPRTRLPKDWKPAAETIAWAKTNFVATDRQVSTEAEKFHAFHYGRGNAMADWPAAWRTWWLNGFHKIPRRMEAAPDLLTKGGASADKERELADAFERARLADEAEARCRR